MSKPYSYENVVLKITFNALLILLIFPATLYAGAWTIDGKEVVVELYGKYYWAEKNYLNNGDVERMPDGGKYSEWREELKIDVGISNRVNVLFSVPYKSAEYENDFNTFKQNGLADVVIGAKLMVLDEEDYNKKQYAEKYKNYPTVSLQVKYNFPAGYDETEPPALGDGKAEVEARVMVGKKLGRKIFPGFALHTVGAELGYRLRDSDLVNKVPFFAEANFELKKGFMLRGMVDGVFTVSGSDVEPTDEERINKKYEEYAKAIVLIRYGDIVGVYNDDKASNLAFEAGYGHTFWGKNTAVGSEIIFSISYKFD